MTTKVTTPTTTNANPIYLDHNATTPLLPEVVDAMLPFLRTELGNPSSSHPWGQRARHAVEEARERVARLLGAQFSDEIYFTSGGTEANNLAIQGIAAAAAAAAATAATTVSRKECVTSVIEHPATANPCRYLEEARGWQVHWIGVDGDACVRLDALEEHLSERTALVTIMHANNETGTMQPIRVIAALAKKHGAIMHTDAAQSIAKVQVDVQALGVDLLSMAGHKLNAPKGVGALYVKRGTRIVPFLLGAGHERGLRPGTENVAGIVGLGVACAAASTTLEAKTKQLTALRERLFHSLRTAIPDLRINGASADRLPNTLSVRFPNARGSKILANASNVVAASTGSACHAGQEHETPSGVLLAMGLPSDEALQTVRLSIGVTTSERDVDVAAEALVHAWREARQEPSAAWE